jgi:sortase (surface protein transpeptidase)
VVWAAAAVALVLVAAALLGAAAVRQLPDRATGSGPPPALLQPVVLRPSPAPVESTLATTATAAPTPSARPAALRIPALELSVPLSGLGLQDDGTVEVPADPDDAGWFRLGPAPGQPGSAVLLGHVDSRRGPGVFFRLHTLRAGDTVDVELDDGSLARFAVTSVATYPKDEFPGELVYGGQGDSTLQLVTCGGDFDRDARSYLSNVVVSAELV